MSTTITGSVKREIGTKSSGFLKQLKLFYEIESTLKATLDLVQKVGSPCQYSLNIFFSLTSIVQICAKLALLPLSPAANSFSFYRCTLIDYVHYFFCTMHYVFFLSFLSFIFCFCVCDVINYWNKDKKNSFENIRIGIFPTLIAYGQGFGIFKQIRRILKRSGWLDILQFKSGLFLQYDPSNNISFLGHQ